jgi:hypothetical protein
MFVKIQYGTKNAEFYAFYESVEKIANIYEKVIKENVMETWSCRLVQKFSDYTVTFR